MYIQSQVPSHSAPSDELHKFEDSEIDLGSNSQVREVAPRFDKKPESNFSAILSFFEKIKETDRVLAVVGCGTAAMTYLSTTTIAQEYSHVVILGDQGYWGEDVEHRLAQPEHILALPHQESLKFVNPEESNNFKSNCKNSAYMHSRDYQVRLCKLKEITLRKLENQKKETFLERTIKIESIFKKNNFIGFQIKGLSNEFLAHKMIIASGSGPARQLPMSLKGSIEASAAKEFILSYSDILTGCGSEKIRNKDILVFGGGATSVWLIETSEQRAKNVTWVAERGFSAAENAGPRVKKCVDSSRNIQRQGRIVSLKTLINSHKESGKKLRVGLMEKKPDEHETLTYLDVDYLVESFGQDMNQEGGLSDIVKPCIQSELTHVLDKNQVSGAPDTTLGLSTPNKKLMIIGAAAANFDGIRESLEHDKTISAQLPKSAQASATIGAVVSSVCALTEYMPLTQDPTTRTTTVTGLNIQIMNATQLAVYFTAKYPSASPGTINKAVQNFIDLRKNTYFGLINKELDDFFSSHFGPLDI